MREIILTQNKIALIDDEDFELVKSYRWCAIYLPNICDYYAATHIQHGDGYTDSLLLMHRLILNAPKGVKTDHKNRQTLDNRKENLRLCTNAENLRNRNKQANNTTGYKGVYFNKQANKFQATIGINNRLVYLGIFDTALEASAVYEVAAQKLHGEFYYQLH